MISKAEKAKHALQRLCPKGTTIFTIERARNDNGVTLDVFKVAPWEKDPLKYESIRLNVFIRDADLFRMTRQHYIRVGGSLYDHSYQLVSRLSDFVWGDERALNHHDLG